MRWLIGHVVQKLGLATKAVLAVVVVAVEVHGDFPTLGIGMFSEPLLVCSVAIGVSVTGSFRHVSFVSDLDRLNLRGSLNPQRGFLASTPNLLWARPGGAGYYGRIRRVRHLPSS